ncbi:MAG: hypothetical protein ACE5GF_07220 [Thermodesulfobacteriota bacterium]
MKTIVVLASIFVASQLYAECREHVVIYGMDYYMTELGMSESRAASYRVNLWDSPNRNRVVGKLIPGTHALLLQESATHWKVKAPRLQGGTVGWIGDAQVEKVVSQDMETNELCE